MIGGSFEGSKSLKQDQPFTSSFGDSTQLLAPPGIHEKTGEVDGCGNPENHQVSKRDRPKNPSFFPLRFPFEKKIVIFR